MAGASAAGRNETVALEFGRGRIVVLGKAAMVTAQTDGRGEKIGMNFPGNDNEEFAPRVFAWLSSQRL
jgi:hypothetical protein